VDPVPTGTLGFALRRVSRGVQGIEVGAGDLGRQTEADRQTPPVGQKAATPPELIGKCFHGRRSSAGDQDAELVSSGPRHEPLGDGRERAREESRHSLQQLIAARMSERIVHVLQAVHVGDDDAHLPPARQMSTHRDLRGQAKATAVHQPR
jgi:hypothetical protein